MLSYDEALKVAEQYAGNLVLIPAAMREIPSGWYFVAQTKEFVGTGDVGFRLIGSGGFVVNRETGRVHEFGSAFPLERNLRMYEKGFQFDSYDLTILTVQDLRKTCEILLKLGMHYVIPETAYGEVWRIPRRYLETDLQRLLQQLPFTFADFDFSPKAEVFDELDAAECCTYELKEHRSR